MILARLYDNVVTPNIPILSQSRIRRNSLQKSLAVARETRDAAAAAVIFGLKFANNIHWGPTSFESQASELQTYRCKTEFNTEWPF